MREVVDLEVGVDVGRYPLREHHVLGDDRRHAADRLDAVARPRLDRRVLDVRVELVHPKLPPGAVGAQPDARPAGGAAGSAARFSMCSRMSALVTRPALPLPWMPVMSISVLGRDAAHQRRRARPQPLLERSRLSITSAPVERAPRRCLAALVSSGCPTAASGIGVSGSAVAGAGAMPPVARRGSGRGRVGLDERHHGADLDRFTFGDHDLDECARRGRGFRASTFPSKSP